MLLPPAVGRVRDCLVSTLETLPSYEFKNFKDKLRKEGFSNTPGRVLQAAEVENLTDHLLSKYGKDFVVERTAAALEAIDLKRHAVALRAHTTDSKKRGERYGKARGCTFHAPLSPGGHFVDRHKKELIEQVTEAPLKELCGCVLDEEQYEALANCATEKMKMEALYQIAQAWETQQKNHLYRALAATNSHIIEALEGKPKRSQKR
uniref:Pyrin domain-containing protein n=1 Tax=Varanus komodoensis TaxID=61221 RepID=A0A8D2LR24_VARKO